MTTETQNDLDVNLLDLDMSSVPDLAGFELPPKGKYLLDLSLEKKEINGKQCVSFNYKVVEALELADPDAEVKPNAVFNTLTELNPERLPYINVKCGILAQALGCTPTLSNLISEVQNIRIEATLKHRKGKAKSADDEAPVYADVPDAGFTVIS